MVLVALGSHDQNEYFVRHAPELAIVVDEDGSVHRAYKVSSTPFAVLVEDGKLRAKGVVNHRDHLERLLEGEMTVRDPGAWRPAGAAAATHEKTQ